LLSELQFRRDLLEQLQNLRGKRKIRRISSTGRFSSRFTFYTWFNVACRWSFHENVPS